jgi:hypothetical protein
MSTSSKTPSIQELRAARGSAKPSSARRFRGWLIAGGLFIALILFCFLGLPPIVKARALSELSTRLGREVTIDKIRINPLVLSVSIEGLAIAEAEKGAGDFAGWKRVYVNLDSWSLLRGTLGFSEIDVDGFHAHVAKGKAGGMNFDDIVAKLTAADSAAKPASAKDPSAKPLALSIGKLIVTDAKVTFDDASRERPFTTVVGPLSFSLEKFHTVGDPNSPYKFEAVTGSGERIAWNGTVSADPVKSQGELTLSNLDLARLSPYYHQFIKGELRSAFADFSGKYTFALAEGAPVLKLSDGSFTLRDVRLGAPGVAADAFALKRLAVTGINADSVALSAAIGRVSIEGVQVKAVRDAEGIDLVRLVTPEPQTSAASAVAAAPTAASGPKSPLPSVTLGEFSLSGVQVDVTDTTTSRPAQHRIDDIKLVVRDIDSTNLAKALPLELTVLLPHEGRIQISGTAAPQPLAAKLAIELANVPFANASPYVEPFLNIRLAEGGIRAKGTATFEKGALTYTGDFGIQHFTAVDGKLAQDFLKFTEVGVSGIQLTSEPVSLAIEEIKIVDPSVAVRIEADGSLSIAKAVNTATLPPPAATPAPEAAEAAPTVTFSPATTAPAATPPPPVSIGRVVLQNGSFRYADASITPAARAALTDFNGTITGLSSAAPARANMDISGKVDGIAPVAITGKLNPLGSPAYSDIKISFKNIDLQPGAGPYVGKFAGYQLSRGSLNVDVDFKLQDRAINIAPVVTLDQFYLGAKTNSPDATKLPVGLALALLRDNNGKIVLDLPVKGSLDDPSFKISRVLWRVITNILVKTATSPFSLLGAAFGGGGDELAYQEFTAGSSELDETDIKKLNTVAKALSSRPALNLDLEGAYDSSADPTALRLAQLDQQIRAAAWEALRQTDPNTPPPEAQEISSDQRAALIGKLYAAAFPAAPAALTPASDSTTGPVAPAPSPASPAPETEPAEVATVVFQPPALPPGLKPRPPRNIGRLPLYPPRKTPAKTTAAEASETAKAAAGAEAAQPVDLTSSDAQTTPAQTGAPQLSAAEMEGKLLGGITIQDEALRALADARAQSVRNWLLEQGKVPAERVFLIAPSAKGSRVQLNLR